MVKRFDPTKPVQTRDGSKARILCTDCKDALGTIVALVTADDGSESMGQFGDTGRKKHSCSALPGDLVNIPEKLTGWINIFYSQIHNTQQIAAAMHSHERPIACIKVEVMRGDGIDG
jgi:hypothetical protein